MRIEPQISAANQLALRRLCDSEVVLEDVQPCGAVVPDFSPDLILTSGPVLSWAEYSGGQREALIGGALFEGLAGSRAEAEQKFAAGSIRIGACQAHACVGSVAGIYTASMPVFVVRNRTFGNLAYCNLYEGKASARLNYGVYNEEVAQRLRFLAEAVGPLLRAAVRAAGCIELTPIMTRALHMGDELHSRNTAASFLFADALFAQFVGLLEQQVCRADTVRAVHRFLTEDNYFFLRLSMAAAKATADAAHNIPYSSLVSAMAINCRSFAIRVSGLGDVWFAGEHADLREAHMFEGHRTEEVTWMGGESVITETVGLGGFAQAAAPALQAYQGGDVGTMQRNNESMYAITLGEHERFRIPYFGYRGTPTGIDLFKVMRTGILPVIDAGLAGRDGGQIGAGVIRAPRGCFERAREAFLHQYGEVADNNTHPEPGPLAIGRSS
jgi:hypothetical protein